MAHPYFIYAKIVPYRCGNRCKGKKALATGGNSGIGFATARLFIHEGAEVEITGRDQKTLDAAVEALVDLGVNLSTPSDS